MQLLQREGIRAAKAAETRNPNNLTPRLLAQTQLQPHDTLQQTFSRSLSDTDQHLFITGRLICFTTSRPLGGKQGAVKQSYSSTSAVDSFLHFRAQLMIVLEIDSDD